MYPTYDSLILLRTVVCAGVFGSTFVLFIDNSIQQRGTVVSVVHPWPDSNCSLAPVTPLLIIKDDCLSAFRNRHRLGSASLEKYQSEANP